MDTREPDQDFAVTAVCTLPPGLSADAVTSDGHVMALWPQDDGTLRWVWDGAAGEPFDGLGEMRDKSPSIFASEDGAHVAYLGIRRDRGVFVGRDDTEDPAIEAFSRSVPPVFSRGGRHLAYGGGALNDCRLILDGRVVSEFPIAAIPAVFSPDGERLVYAEVRGEGGTIAEARTVLDGMGGEWFAVVDNSASAWQFSPDSRRFAFGRFDGNGPARWVVDGAPQHLGEAANRIGFAQVRKAGVGEPPLVGRFSPDSRRFVYLADAPGRGMAVIEDGVAGPLVKAIGTLVFSPDSRHLAYLAETLEGAYTLVLDGVAGPTWPAKEGGGPVFSPDGRHTAFIVRRDEGSFLRRRRLYTLVVDGQAIAELQGHDAATPSFSPDSERVAWCVKQGAAWPMMVGAEPHPGGDRARSAPVHTASGRLAYVASVGPGEAVTVMVDGRPGPITDGLAAQQSVLHLFGRELAPDPDVPPFAVSPDGEHVAWMGMLGVDHAKALVDEVRPILDDQVGPAFDLPLAWSFDADGRATWYAQRGDVVYRVTAAP